MRLLVVPCSTNNTEENVCWESVKYQHIMRPWTIDNLFISASGSISCRGTWRTWNGQRDLTQSRCFKANCQHQSFLFKKTEKDSFIFLHCSFFPLSLLLPWWELQVTAGSETCGIYWSAEASRKDGGRIMRLPGQPGIKVDPCLPFLASHFGQVRRNPSLYKIRLSHKSHRASLAQNSSCEISWALDWRGAEGGIQWYTFMCSSVAQ